jgi:hypothetical protein
MRNSLERIAGLALIFVMLCGLGLFASTAYAQSKPNIVFIMGDDIGM